MFCYIFTLRSFSLSHVPARSRATRCVSEPVSSATKWHKNARWQADQSKVTTEPRSPLQQPMGGGDGGTKRAAGVQESS